MTGTWRFFFNEGDTQEHVDLGPYDTISMPVGVARGFINITKNANPEEENLLLHIIGGNAPIAEYTTDTAKKYQG